MQPVNTFSATVIKLVLLMMLLTQSKHYFQALLSVSLVICCTVLVVRIACPSECFKVKLSLSLYSSFPSKTTSFLVKQRFKPFAFLLDC
jgi:hypothetical protein